ncbi:MAG: hypothetical protein HW383_123 [Candidatus Magasanikbacteria bacterium]|nr:hypothetical protein [Candidatus Magasanikbacteria bacterium]
MEGEGRDKPIPLNAKLEMKQERLKADGLFLIDIIPGGAKQSDYGLFKQEEVEQINQHLAHLNQTLLNGEYGHALRHVKKIAGELEKIFEERKHESRFLKIKAGNLIDLDAPVRASLKKIKELAAILKTKITK